MFSGAFNDDRNWLAAGVVAAVLIPVLVFAARLPFALSMAVAVAAFIGLVLLLAPRKLFEGMDVSRVAKGRLDVVRKVLSDAGPALERLEAASRRISTETIRQNTSNLAVTARTIFNRIEQNPDRMTSVQRFLTYYLPAAAELAESYGVLEQQRAPDPQRLKQAETVIGKLSVAFSHYADTMLESDLAGLEVDLRLIERSVKEDLGSAR